MARVRSTDAFAQVASAQVVETAANTLTFQQLQTGGMLFERRAFNIHRIEYHVNAGALDAEGDTLSFGWCVSNQITAPAANDVNVVDLVVARRADFGTAASGQFYITPIVRDFGVLPGMGFLVPSHPLYLYAVGASLAAAATVTSRFYFTLADLSPEQYIELVEAMRIIT